MLNALRKVYKYGGYSTFNISILKSGGGVADKKVLITGGSSGIGFHIARKLISEGARVLITGRSHIKLKHALEKIDNPNLKTLCWDISSISQLEKYILKTKELLGGDVNVLINNAAIRLEGQKNFPYVNEEMWDKTYAVNSKGLFFLTQAITREWIDQKEFQIRKIINISSQGGVVGATYPYRLTKWDIVGLTQGLGIKLAPYGIIVNGIAPGIVATEMQSRFMKQEENVYCSLNPIERFALPEEIAELAFFLISDAANFIVGQTIICDGGFSLK